MDRIRDQSGGGRPALADGFLWVPSGSLVIADVAAGCGQPTCGPWLTTFMALPADQPVTDVTVVDDIVLAASDLRRPGLRRPPLHRPVLHRRLVGTRPRPRRGQ